ncbi:MAG TPA: glutamine-hydrolyzing GMP synthase, partial [Planctomycetaceae bacterium]|nr:glutamine-hydrolyzing GMP synthase [Planctomycetaceae bacterium]
MSTLPQSSPASSRAVADERVLVLDFGSQYAQLIARRIREQNVYCEIVRHDITPEQILAHRPRGLILSGGPASVYEEGAPRCDPRIFELGLPVLGICYGMQLVCDILGGRVQSSSTREYGRARCEILRPSELFDGIPEETDVWMSHGDQVTQVAESFIPLAATDTCPIAAVQHESLPVFGLQFHPEVTHTPQGSIVLRNFVMNVCGCRGTWKLADFARETIADIRQRVGSARVICGLSGGVDSAVTAALLYEAIGDRLSCILVDNGLLRKDEQAAVIAEFSHHFRTDLHVVQAEDRFLEALRGVTEPQEKRRIIGHCFIDCFKE